MERRENVKKGDIDSRLRYDVIILYEETREKEFDSGEGPRDFILKSTLYLPLTLALREEKHEEFLFNEGYGKVESTPHMTNDREKVQVDVDWTDTEEECGETNLEPIRV